MNSVILQIASRLVSGLMIFFALIALLRGHNFPGGGFIGGLLAGLSVVYKGFAYTNTYAKQNLRIHPIELVGFGLLSVLISFIPGLLKKEPIMKGIWYNMNFPVLGEVKIGTPLLFDIGIFLAVAGVVVLFLFSLTEHK
jgi:multicomponent Na+:H+ antiporter subunit B